jgi:hypothetical protein
MKAKVKKKKSRVPGSAIRNLWPINPVTRVHDKDITRNKKKQRRADREVVEKALDEENPC